MNVIVAVLILAQPTLYVGDEAGFLADVPPHVVTETFDEAPDAVTTLTGVQRVHFFSSDGVFSPADVPREVSVFTTGSSDLIVAGPTQTTQAIGPTGAVFFTNNNDIDSMVVEAPPPGAIAIGVHVHTEGANTATITVRAPITGAVLITQDVTDDTFFGAIGSTSEPIGTIEVSAPDVGNGAFEGIGSVHVARIGTDALLRIDDELPGPNCANGGQAVHAGVDLDVDGALDDEEIETTSYLCDEVTEEPAADDDSGCNFFLGAATPPLSFLGLICFGSLVVRSRYRRGRPRTR